MRPSSLAQACWVRSQHSTSISWGPLSQTPLNMCIHGQVIYPACHLGLMKMLLWLMAWAFPQKVRDPKWVLSLSFLHGKVFIVYSLWILDGSQCCSQEECFLSGISLANTTMINTHCFISLFTFIEVLSLRGWWYSFQIHSYLMLLIVYHIFI